MRGKLGRLRRDTLRDIGIQRAKDRKRKKEKNLSNSFETKGDNKLILAKFDSYCRVCGETIRIGQFIWFNPKLKVTQRVCHKDCLLSY